jgi:hypothetical protein
MMSFRVGPEMIDNTVPGDGEYPRRESCFVAAVFGEIDQRLLENDRGEVLRRLLVIDPVMDIGEYLRHKLIVELREDIGV